MPHPNTGQTIPQFRYLFRSIVLDPALLYAHVLTAEVLNERLKGQLY